MSDATMSAEQKEALHRAAEAKIVTFAYQKPAEQKDRDGEPMVKQIANLMRGDLMRLNVQIVKEGGENNLHYHTGGDTVWMVLKGAARFYGVGDKLLGEIGPNGGIHAARRFALLVREDRERGYSRSCRSCARNRAIRNPRASISISTRIG